MNLVKPYARMLFYPQGMLSTIEFCGRISHRSEDKQTTDTWARFLQSVVIEHGDWSIVEHISVSCEFLVDRGITHELVRHRLFSFTQESTRFVNYVKKMPASFVLPDGLTNEQDNAWRYGVEASELAYQRMIEAGASPQIARSVFPNALASKIIVTGNLRNWRHFFIMRTTKETHPQMKEVTIPLLEEFNMKIPVLFDDIEPNIRQIEGMKKAR